jgi:hypothetical protein
MENVSSLSTRLRNLDVSRQIARLEKELGFWGKMYSNETLVITGTALQQVEQIQSFLEIYRERYRAKMEKDLGQGFLVEPLDTMNSHDPLRHYFFPMEYREEFVGVILPFTKEKKVIFNPRLKKNKHALEVFQSKGYNIEKVVCGYSRSTARYLIIGDEEDVELSLSMKDLI